MGKQRAKRPIIDTFLLYSRKLRIDMPLLRVWRAVSFVYRYPEFVMNQIILHVSKGRILRTMSIPPRWNRTQVWWLRLKLVLMQQPCQQIYFGRNGNRLHDTLVVLLRDDGGTVPFEEPVKRTERRVERYLGKLATPRLRASAVAIFAALVSFMSARREFRRMFGDISRICHDLRQLRKIEHQVGDGRLACRSAVRDPTQCVPKCDEAH